MKTEELAGAVCISAPWLKRFTKKEYTEAFQDYCAQYAPMFEAAAAEYGDRNELAEGIVSAIDARLKKERFWNRGVAKADAKTVMIVYLLPMLLESNEFACRELCSCLCESWNRKHLIDTVSIGDFQSIRSGFKDKLLGFEYSSQKER